MFCSNCGKKLEKGELFCSECGTKVEWEDEAPVQEEPVQATEPVKAADPAKASTSKDEKKPNFLLPIIVIVALLAVVGILWKTGVLFSSEDEDEESTIVSVLEKDKKDDSGKESKVDSTTAVAETTAVVETTKAAETTTAVETTAETTTASPVASFPTTQIIYEGDAATVQDLMDRNIKFNMEMYHFGNHLPTDGKSAGPNLEYVTSKEFSTFNSYTAYVRNLYSSAVAENIIVLAKYFSTADGRLAYNTAFAEEDSEYYVNWDVYTIEVTKASDTKIEFNVQALEAKPGKEKAIYSTTGVAVKENGVWKLEKEVY